MGKRVLIAEDEPHIVESLRFVLERDGFEVRSVSDGAAVIDKVRTYEPHVLVLDVMLPNRNGFEVLKCLKGDHDLAAIPVLMLTAKGQDQDRATADRLKVDAFITKPFANREVVECIRRLVDNVREDAAG
ncbi:MAG: response regulator [Proteobacteria bacterium]|nr:MAG: response regulator [Pseudomonadota bacterium]